MIKHLGSNLALALALASPPAGIFVQPRTYAGYTMAEVMRGISWAETGHDPRAVGKLGEVSQYQILDICRRDFNRVNRTNITMAQIAKSPTTAYRVGSWRFDRAWENFHRLHPRTQLACALSAYNRGERKTRKRIGWDYRDKVIGYIKTKETK